MTKLTESVQYPAHIKPVLSMSESAYHAREGNALHKWVNDITPGDAVSILGQESICHNLAEGEQVFVTQATFDLETVSKDVHFDIVACTAADGGGDATALCGHCHIFTGATISGAESKEREFMPPIRARYSDGVRSITMRVDAEAATTLSCGWMGWKEDE